MIKKIISFIYVSLFCVLTISAQMNKEGRKKIKALKIAYLTEQLELTPNEAEKFWPIYNTYDKEQSKLRNGYRSNLKKIIKQKGTINNVTEEEAKNLIALKLNSDKKLYEAQANFINKIKGILSYKKIIKLQIAEMEFGRKLMRKYKHKRPNPRD